VILPHDETGSGPPVILLHAGVADRSMCSDHLPPLAAGDIDGAVDAVLAAWTQPDAPDALRARVGAMQRRGFVEHGAEPEPDYAPDPIADGAGALAGIRCPALCLAGEHDMPDFADAAPRLAAALPAGRHAVIAGAGHLASLETPESFRAIMLEFLAA